MRSKPTYCFLGDSITDGIGTSKRYIEYISEWTGATTYGFGVNGAESISLLSQLDRMEQAVDAQFDILFVFIGTNDFYSGIPIGTFFTEHTENVPCNRDSNHHDTEFAVRKKREFVMDDSTFCGRLNLVLSRIRKQYPDKRIIFMTPLHRAYAYFGGNNIQPNELYANRAGCYFDEYIQAERTAADIWSVELIDLYRESGLFPLFDESASLYFSNKETDRLHPNAEGHRKIAETILRNLSSVSPEN